MKKKKIQSMYQNKDYNEQEMIEDDRGWMDGQTGRQIDIEWRYIIVNFGKKYCQA